MVLFPTTRNLLPTRWYLPTPHSMNFYHVARRILHPHSTVLSTTYYSMVLLTTYYSMVLSTTYYSMVLLTTYYSMVPANHLLDDGTFKPPTIRWYFQTTYYSMVLSTTYYSMVLSTTRLTCHPTKQTVTKTKARSVPKKQNPLDLIKVRKHSLERTSANAL
jgi:hypothetical protein